MILNHLIEHHAPMRVLHVGASRGQEARHYKRFGVDHVTWIEALQSECVILRRHLKGRTDQRVIQALVLNADGMTVDFHIATNRGESSSVFPLGRHRQAYPHISYRKTIRLESRRLDTLLQFHHVPYSLFDTLVMDIQGAELLALKGMGAYLDSIRAAVIEVAPIAIYEGGCAEAEVQQFMETAGFKLRARVIDPIVNAGDALYVRS